MDINATLIIQMLVFAAFVWFTMKFVWPPIVKALDERQQKISDGLAAAERGQRELELAQHRVKDALKSSKAEAADIVDNARKRAAQLVDEAKDVAQKEAQHIFLAAEAKLKQEILQAREKLRVETANLVLDGVEKLLQSNKSVEKMIEEL